MEYDAPRREIPDVSGWAIGGMSFAAAMMLLIGAFQFFAGLAAVINDDFLVHTRNYAFDLGGPSHWGWIHLLLGILMIGAGIGLFMGNAAAGAVTLVLVILSAIANFFTIPNQPWWAILVIALDVWVIWALTRPGVMSLET